MTDLKAIEAAVSHLSPPDLEKFRAWFEDHVGAIWDERIERDVSAGKLDALADAALAEHFSGRTKKL